MCLLVEYGKNMYVEGPLFQSKKGTIYPFMMTGSSQLNTDPSYSIGVIYSIPMSRH